MTAVPSMTRTVISITCTVLCVVLALVNLLVPLYPHEWNKFTVADPDSALLVVLCSTAGLLVLVAGWIATGKRNRIWTQVDLVLFLVLVARLVQAVPHFEG